MVFSCIFVQLVSANYFCFSTSPGIVVQCHQCCIQQHYEWTILILKLTKIAKTLQFYRAEKLQQNGNFPK